MLPGSLTNYAYKWPQVDLERDPRWEALEGYPVRARQMPESVEELAIDSRWPAFFPCPISLVTTTDGKRVGLEKVVGASIVNRFPYVIALSFCREELSHRHYVRQTFTDILEMGGAACVQFLPPGPELDRVMGVIASVPDGDSASRILRTGLGVLPGLTNASPVFGSSYMAYEARLVKPGKDFDGQPIYETPWINVGSHRVYFLEINAIQLREDIAEGRSQIAWRSLPSWRPQFEVPVPKPTNGQDESQRYRKGYAPNYRFPSATTAAFEFDETRDGMKVKYLPPLPEDQVEVDNDRARWPCFFPSSAGMITGWAESGVPNLMPCGSTTILSRHPLTFAVAVSYAAINQRYAPRESLKIIRQSGTFGCAVPFINDNVLAAIRYAGNTSLARDRDKATNSGLHVYPLEWAPVAAALPVHFDCEVVAEQRLGTHVLFLGEARRILVRTDLSPANPLEWCPWAAVIPAQKDGSSSPGERAEENQPV